MVARINSILSKVTDSAGEIIIDSEEERNLIMNILKLNASYEACFKEKSLNLLCTSVFDLASSFSSFYNSHKILTEPNIKTRKSYIALITLIRNVLKQAMWVLGIECPERM
jgi:arginyl-tRNA synthetase